MNFLQFAALPYLFQVEEGLIDSISLILKKKKLDFQKPLIITGASYSKRIGNIIKNQFKSPFMYYDAQNDYDNIQKLTKLINEEGIDIIISVGGGKIGDLGKKVSLDNKIPNLIFPTLISNDGLISPISVIKNRNGKTESIPGQTPLGIIIDLNIIAESPNQFILSAAGDILSNLSALQDWIFASKNYNVAINDLAFTLSKNSALSIIESRNINSKDKTFIRGIISGQINSGIAMILSGNSRPCSGSEHLISHALDYLDLSEELHGIQVGKLSLFTLYLHNKLDSNILNYAKSIKIDGRINALLSQKTAINVFGRSRKMRINRRTILDNFNNEELYSKYKEFLEFSKIIDNRVKF